MKYAFLSGGTGTPKLLQGVRQIISDKEIGVICNSGDDYSWNGLYITPDLDTILYLFSGKLDINKFWGVNEDTFESLEILKSLKADDTWFNVGDRDLALHIYRTAKLKNNPLTEVVENIRSKWNIEATILPMSNNQIQTRIFAGNNNYNFQEYFVKLKTNIQVTDVKFVGEAKETTDQVRKILDAAKKIIIGPSNPITSIGPILSIERITSLLQKYRDKVIVVSPIKRNQAFSGPTVKLLRSMGIEPSPIGIANYYRNIASTIVFDDEDKDQINKIKDLEIEPIFQSIDLSTADQKKNLANTIFDFI